MFSVRFWGVRGSIPCPSGEMIGYGGNTTCLEMRADDRIIIIDSGSGIFRLGDHIMRNDSAKGPLDIDIFITHTHLDHILGFPMFAPLFLPNAKIRIHGPKLAGEDTLESAFTSLVSHPHWPIRFNEFAAKVSFRELKAQTSDLGGGLKCSSTFLNHPVLCLGYRFEYKGKTVVTAFDTEPFRNVFAGKEKDGFFGEDAAYFGAITAKSENEKLAAFYKDADILIYDSQYTDEEYEGGKTDWGHSTYSDAIKVASAANVKKLVLFHHEPNRADAFLSELEDGYSEKYKSGSALEVIVSKEGLIVET